MSRCRSRTPTGEPCPAGRCKAGEAGAVRVRGCNGPKHDRWRNVTRTRQAVGVRYGRVAEAAGTAGRMARAAREINVAGSEARPDLRSLARWRRRQRRRGCREKRREANTRGGCNGGDVCGEGESMMADPSARAQVSRAAGKPSEVADVIVTPLPARTEGSHRRWRRRRRERRAWRRRHGHRRRYDGEDIPRSAIHTVRTEIAEAILRPVAAIVAVVVC